MLDTDISQYHQFLFAVQVTGRVIRITDHNRLGIWRYGFLKCFDRRQGEVLFNSRTDRYYFNTSRNSKAIVVSVERLWYNNFITRIQTGHHRKRDGF
ncbi:hypothetical protein D3C80_1825970 [compost metagenome]